MPTQTSVRTRPDSRSRTPRQRDYVGLLAVPGQYGLATLLGIALVACWLRVWDVPSEAVFPGGGDPLYVQANLEVWGEGGPFARDEQLSWPTGHAPWSLPQLGLGMALTAPVLMGLLGLGSAAAVLWTYALTAGACACAVLFLLRGLATRAPGSLLIVLAALVGAGPFVLEKEGFGHLNIAAVYPVIALFGVLVRWSESGRRARFALCGLACAVTLLGPLWWSVVILLLLGGLGALAVLRRDWAHVRALLHIGVSASLGLVVPVGLYVMQKDETGVATRSPWDSNTYGGRAVDLLLSSPFLNERLGRLQDLVAGASVEPSKVGLFLGMMAVYAAVVAVAREGVMPTPLTRSVDRVRAVLTDLASITLLAFLAGGLGNLQAAGAVLLGGTSPARVWSRLSVLLGVLGLALLLTTLERGWRAGAVARRGTACVVAASAALMWLGDARALPRLQPVEAGSVAEAPAVEFLRSRLGACPVAQLPLDAFPLPRAPVQIADVSTYYYRPLVPFLLAPEYSWSYGAQATGSGLETLPVELGADSEAVLVEQGFCAVLFDESLARISLTNGLQLQGSALGALGEPDLDGDRYDVYVLTP